ncbi:tyrosine-type recombinase/integrase [Leifsonia virtsii]|uniref:Tyrosine-type recombinase/integrase n=2 Tax=Bacteria TaxID=2 RepID=A0ABT8J2I2_9MICO|nr:tyrosine-type recombinase/integrase [Leifsonia virtsii]MDN4599299.1 tyrosine-type recombinase/integrase [Leifsonia virtsii]
MSEPDISEDPVSRGLRLGDVPLARVGSVKVELGAAEPYMLLDGKGRVVEPVSAWVRNMVVGDHSPRTIRSYCYAALTWFRVLWQLDVGWERATEAETAALVSWLRVAPNPQRRRQAGTPAVNLKTGKPNLGLGYGAATINLTLAAVRGFYDFHAHWGRGPVINPVPESPARRRALAHRSPLEPRQAYRRGAYRQRAQPRAPRSIPDAMWEEFFAQMPSDRDRALVACYVSSGARAEELLGAQLEDVDWARQRMSVVSKGSRERRMVPLSPEALTWLSRYLRTFGDASSGPLWRTVRGEPRPLTYGAARRVLQRANGRLGTNWTLHDLRHTAAMRMVNSGVLTMPEVQVVLGHADLRTTSIYTTPRIDEVIDKVHEHYARPAPPPPRFASGYAAEDIAIIFGHAGE